MVVIMRSLARIVASSGGGGVNLPGGGVLMARAVASSLRRPLRVAGTDLVRPIEAAS